jgi:hypothetical protein
LSTPVTYRYIRVEIVDTSNPDGYVQLNRFIVAPAWEPSLNMSYGGSVGWVSGAENSKTLGGATIYDRRKAARTHRFTIENMTPAQAMAYPFEMQRLLDLDREVFFVYDPSDTDLLLKQRSFLATMRQLNPIEYPYYNSQKVAFDLTEKL